MDQDLRLATLSGAFTTTEFITFQKSRTKCLLRQILAETPLRQTPGTEWVVWRKAGVNYGGRKLSRFGDSFRNKESAVSE